MAGDLDAKLDTLCVGETAPERIGEVSDRRLWSSDVSPDPPAEMAPAPGSGSRVSRVNRENTPFLASHWKYRLPEIDPSFLPFGSSSTTPAQSPGAKCVSPMYAMWPGRSPPTQTRCPMMKLSVSAVRTTPWSGRRENEREIEDDVRLRLRIRWANI